MERRLLTFIVASTAFFFVYAWLRVMFAPPIDPALAENEKPDAAVVAQDEGAAQNIADVERSDLPTDASQRAGEETAAADVATDSAVTERPDQSWQTAGSMDPTSGFYLLVTANNRGGAIERIELTERDERGDLKYRRVDVFNGYLGYLAVESAPTVDGALVNIVGPGTPADLAGIKVGDIITSVGDVAVATRIGLEDALQKTEPGDQISLQVLRDDSPDPVTLQATLTQHPLDLVRLARDGGADQVPGNLSRLSCRLTLAQVNRKRILGSEDSIAGLSNPAELNWSVETTEADGAQRLNYSVDLSAAEMAAVDGRAVRLRRSFLVSPGSYAIDMTAEVENLSDQPQELALRLEGPNGITLEGWWYSTKISPNFSGAAARDVVFNSVADGNELISGYNLLKRAKDEPDDPNQAIFARDSSEDARKLKYITVDAQYFTVGYVPVEGQAWMTDYRRAAAGVAADPQRVPRHQERAVNSTFYLDSDSVTVAQGQPLKLNLRLFAGPKQPELLAKYGLQETIYYGWFSTFARLLAALLHVLSGVGNYAVAIILLTVIVRGMMFPLSRKAAVNAQKMQELAPELKKINDKYKDDMEGKLKAQRELQQKVGFNPLAGCLPMFLQLPIFIGLYRALSVDIELRQAAFNRNLDWASNLAAPDMLYYWGDWLWEYLSGRGTGWLGPYFNILPVLVVALFLAQQKMFMPPATDEQTAMTQKVMNIMTLMMGLFFFRVPAGLCIYFITSSLWGICERVLVKKTLPTTKHFESLLNDADASPDQKPQSLADRLRSKVAQPDPPIQPPNKRKRPKKK